MLEWMPLLRGRYALLYELITLTLALALALTLTLTLALTLALALALALALTRYNLLYELMVSP